MKKADSIIVEQGRVNAHLNWVMFSNKGIFVGIIPTLNIVAKAEQEEKLNEELTGMVRNYFNYFTGKKLTRKLNALGWKNFNPPESFNLPIEVMKYDNIGFKTIEFSN